MGIRLRLALKTLKHTLASNRSALLKATLYALMLLFAVREDFSFGSMVLFIGLSLGMYLQPVFQTMHYLSPFVLLVFLSLFTLRVFYVETLEPYLASLFALFFFLLLGLKNVSFIHRRVWYVFFELCLLYLATSAYFIVDKSEHLILASAVLYISTYILSKRFFLVSGMRASRHVKTASGLLALIALELSWMFGALPIGFLSSAGIIILYLGIMQEMMRLYMSGQLTPRALRYYLLTFIIFFIFTLLASPIRI